MQFKVVTSQNKDTFEKEVNKYLKSKWRIRGYVTISSIIKNNTITTVFLQTLVK